MLTNKYVYANIDSSKEKRKNIPKFIPLIAYTNVTKEMKRIEKERKGDTVEGIIEHSSI